MNGMEKHIHSHTSTVQPNGLSEAIIWTNAGLLLIGPLGTNFSEILIEILTFSFRKMRLKVSSAKRRPFCLGLNMLRISVWPYSKLYTIHLTGVHVDVWHAAAGVVGCFHSHQTFSFIVYITYVTTKLCASITLKHVPSAGVQVFFATQGTFDLGSIVGWFYFMAL